ncbi:LON peptidase N-terminal domain and RING finger protein 3 [Choanephora cucurbitarum]|uniref:LON peptidase N-terminal domain and RING finger protein 3 n=1 Tax=Choanephora cucurbitarum TaxID=101091 RepID=A0A1C7NCB9_9FUNG|nr:LON peptidase N-terminal domain and RING finger protein 3 [Choanephora cucurbitarum]
MTDFQCFKCKQMLVKPTTLSCGYTICMSCLPSQSANQKSVFVCPVNECKKESHLFGPSLYLDDMVDNLMKKNTDQLSTVLQCTIGNHPLSSPVTNHCGHTFCRLCLLMCKISNDQCNQCQKRLPSYQYIQQQPCNYLIEDLLLKQEEQTPLTTTNNLVISFSNLTKTSYHDMPIYLSEFPVLPSQKLRIPIYTENHRQMFLKSLLRCNEYQSLCLAIITRSKQHYNNRFGTIVKIGGIEQRNRDMIVDLVGYDRFQITSVSQQTDTVIMADIEMKFEAQQDLSFIPLDKHHWTEYQTTKPKEAIQQEPEKQHYKRRKIKVNKEVLPPSPNSSSTDDAITTPSTTTPPVSPPREPIDDETHMSTSIKLSNRVHEFISTLARSKPSNSFCSALEGLLGPVWLESVQGLHGPLPAADHAVAMCWWAATVMPVSNTDRYHVLASDSLEDRLIIVLSWISDLESQWGNCRRTAVQTAAKVWQ